MPWPPPAGHAYRTGDPVIDLLMSRADPQVLAVVTAVRLHRLMAANGLDAHRELAAAAAAAVSGDLRQPADDEPAGKLLRRIAKERSAAENHLAAMANLPPGPVPESELRERVRRGEVAALLRLLLDGRQPGHLLAAEVQQQRV